jgi:O-antigen/teichoic acid export membrane protein
LLEKDNTYRQILKGTTLFGGVQFLNVLISIVRSKLIAILIGPMGIGIAGLLNSTIGIITGLTSFGLGTSAVKNVASAISSNDERKLSTTVIVLGRWVWVTGLFGMVITICCSTLLSNFTFGNSQYRFLFAYLSISLLLNQIATGRLIILQGMRKLKLLAKASLIGNFFGLIISLPFYYFLQQNGVVYAIISTSLVNLLCAIFFSKTIKFDKIHLTITETINNGLSMLKMGFFISISGLMTLFVSYLVQLFISHQKNVNELGLYSAGFAIINTYVGLVFNAMGTDYYPRLASVANDNNNCRNIINKQAEIALIVLSPIILFFLIFIKWGIILLYSYEFIEIYSMLQWAALGMIFKALSWSISFIIIAKSDSKIFFWNELSANLYMLITSIIGYYYYGLTGLGIAFLISYLLYLIQVFVIAKLNYNFSFEKKIIEVFSIHFVLILIGFFLIKNFSESTSVIFGIVLILCSLSFSILQLNRILDFNIFNIIKKKSRNKL